jgi:hypothetical protein
MALFALLGVLRGFPVAAYRGTPHRKPMCDLDRDKNCSFLYGHFIGSITFLDGHYVVFVFKAFSLEPLNPWILINRLTLWVMIYNFNHPV